MSVGRQHRIAVTGGPGGGKTTAVDLFRRELGERVVVVPEAATMLFSGGFPRDGDARARRAAQRAIYHVQRNIEDIQCAHYPDRVLLCDRGTVDGGAYWPDSSDDFFADVSSRLVDELARYDAVVFFETAAVGGMSIEGGNLMRVESEPDAVMLDRKLRTMWRQHHAFSLVEHRASFFEKLTIGLDAIRQTINALDGKPT